MGLPLKRQKNGSSTKKTKKMGLPLKRQKKRVFHTIPITGKVDFTFLVMGIASEIHLCALHMINISVGFIRP